MAKGRRQVLRSRVDKEGSTLLSLKKLKFKKNKFGEERIMKIRAMISDFNGSLNDSYFEGLKRIRIIAAMNEIKMTDGKMKKLIALWGSYGPVLIKEGLGIAEDFAKHIYRQWEIWDEEDLVPLVNGVREVLEFNRKRGILTTLLTSRNRENMKAVLEGHGIMKDIALVQTPQDWPIKKPDPKTFDYTLRFLEENYGIKRDECVFVGDTSIDVEAGVRAGIETFVVLTGPYRDQPNKYPVKPENVLESIKGWPLWHEINAD